MAFTICIEIGWLAAYYFAIFAANRWDGIWHDLAEIGFAAGAIGGLATIVAAKLAFVSHKWTAAAWAIPVGALAGLLLPVDYQPQLLVPLFYVWHAGMAVTLAATLNASDTKPWRET